MPARRTGKGDEHVTAVGRGTQRQDDRRFLARIQPGLVLAGAETNRLLGLEIEPSIEGFEPGVSAKDDEHLFLVLVGVEPGKPGAGIEPIVVHRDVFESKRLGEGATGGCPCLRVEVVDTDALYAPGLERKPYQSFPAWSPTPSRFFRLPDVARDVVDRREFEAGLAATREYVLSHHARDERHRCYAPTLFGRQVHLCARCSGVYPGIALGLLAGLAGPTGLPELVLIAVLPIGALVDWTTTEFTGRQGSNVVRTATGALLGFAYGLGLVALFLEGQLLVLAIGFGYALVAGGLLVVADRA